MFTISNNNIISLSRGDEVSTPIFINWGTQIRPVRYTLQDGDKLYFYLYEPNYSCDRCLLEKEYTNKDLNEYGDVILTFDESDTKHLLPGEYYYEIKVERVETDGELITNEIMNTIVPQTKFFIVE